MYSHSVNYNGKKIGDYYSDVQLGAGELVECAAQNWKIVEVRYALNYGRLEVVPMDKEGE